MLRSPTLRRVFLSFIALCLSTALIACGSTPPPDVDKDGLRKRADEEHSNL